MYAATIITISATAMFRVKKVSSSHGAIGSTIKAKMATDQDGGRQALHSPAILAGPLLKIF